jgi:hypothetical protein
LAAAPVASIVAALIRSATRCAIKGDRLCERPTQSSDSKSPNKIWHFLLLIIQAAFVTEYRNPQVKNVQNCEHAFLSLNTSLRLRPTGLGSCHVIVVVKKCMSQNCLK